MSYFNCGIQIFPSIQMLHLQPNWFFTLTCWLWVPCHVQTKTVTYCVAACPTVSKQPKAVDLVLEEVVEADLKDLNQEVPSKAMQPEPPQPFKPAQTTQPSQTTQSQPAQPKQPVKPEEPEQTLPNVPESTTPSLEDAETQTGRWTPFIESIKREAEGVAMATMEER